MAKLKGNILASRLVVLDKLFGKQGRESIWPLLTVDEREVLEGKILPASWYDGALLVKLMTLVDSELGAGDHELTRRMGYHAAAIQLGDVYGTFIRPGKPEFLLNRCSTIWNLTHDFGRVEVELIAESKSRIRLYGIDLVTVMGLVGWVHQGLEMSGCKNIRYRGSPLQGRGPEVFEMRWAWDI